MVEKPGAAALSEVPPEPAGLAAGFVTGALLANAGAAFV
jgi:hypothetical protein